ncbi:MAG: proteasome accessory factor PafA2 family protein [Methanophagales archaeon]|nr:proteasome accessory factor PafA2 family protein [Methanophagales archaeon]MCW3141239.1 proteasome accessory factor PafA2 family protein [Methanophagales archaeon]
MKSNLNKWQGIEQEFRIGISSILKQYKPQEVHRHAIQIFNALKRYKFFDERPAIIYSSKNFNGFMRNGSRIYLCDFLPEIATPECRNAFEKEKFRIQCWKVNTELKPEFTRGTHENYSIDAMKFKKEGEFKKDCLIPFLILKPIFFGAGGYVSEGASDFSGLEEIIEKAKYVVSPKAMATRRVYGGGGTRKHSLFSIRGISNLRIHVDGGEGLRSEVARLLNNAITSYVIQAIESGKIDKVEGIEDPIGTFRALSRNIEGDWEIKLENSERINALDYLNSTYIDALDERK